LSYLLDTNTWIAFLRWQNPGVLTRLKRHPADEILLCSVVVAELWFGAERSDPARRSNNIKLVDELVAKYASLPFDDLAARDYAVIRSHLANSGQLIGPNDMMIAAIVRKQGVTLVTNNTTEFSRVPGLSIEDWQST
jgi:tRNA(fMet)-specific endonuclease VapC